MGKLLDFLYRRRTGVLFIVLEVVCFWLVVSFNQRQNADFLNSSNSLAAYVSTNSQNVSDYFSLTEINSQLMRENELLQKRLLLGNSVPDSLRIQEESYSTLGARVINNTFRRSTNYLTISSGSNDGVEVGMGVISPVGIVGQVKSVSENYATIYSVLHPNLMISSELKRTNTVGTVQWDQRSYNEASLKFIPRHIDMRVGDTVVTSGFNSVFPSNSLIGIVSDFNLEEQMTFYEARITLSTDFTSLPNVFVVLHDRKLEKDSIEAR